MGFWTDREVLVLGERGGYLMGRRVGYMGVGVGREVFFLGFSFFSEVGGKVIVEREDVGGGVGESSECELIFWKVGSDWVLEVEGYWGSMRGLF